MRKLSGLGAGIVAVAALGALGALAGCSAADGTASAATGQLEQRTITVDSVPAAEEAALYVAQAQGLFAKQGLTVKIKSVTGGEAAIPNLQSNSAQLVAGNYVSFVLAQMAGKFDGKTASLRIIAPGGEMTPGTEELYVMPGSKFQTVAELARAHARIGLNTANDVGQVLVGALLSENGYTRGDIRQVTPPGGFPQVMTMLKAGQIDAAWLPQPLAEQAEQEFGAVPIADFDQGSLQDFPFTGYIGTTQWVKSHPNTVAAFLRALQQGDQLADTDRSVVEAALEKYMRIPPIVAATMAINTYPLAIDVPQLERVADAMYEFGLTPAVRVPYNIESMIQTEPGEIGG
jgi:NitT/TauT family transport system substrate-binding protein